MEPVRKIRPNNGCITGKRPSFKTNSSHGFESSLERDFLILLEYNEEVIDYCVQPLTMEVAINDKKTSYTPDVAVYFYPVLHKVPLLCEIKYQQELQSYRAYYTSLFEMASRYALLNGLQFQVFTEKEVRTPYLANVKFLSRYLNGPVDQQYYTTIHQLFTEQDGWSAQELVQVFSPREKDGLLYTLWQLVARKEVHCDLQLPLTMSTLLSLPL